MPRSRSSARWLERQRSDPYVKQARQAGYRSRAACKLAEIDAHDRLFRPGMTVVDLGAAPGGWSQYARQHIGPKGRVLAVDILLMKPIAGVECLQGNFTKPEMLDLLLARLGGKRVDLVISDMAPNISGVTTSDQAQTMYLGELALDFARKRLTPGGWLLLKTFQGAGYPELRKDMQRSFEKLAARKPRASRPRSREIYLLGKGFLVSPER